MKNPSLISSTPLLLNGIPIECVDEYIYLGQKITMDSSKDKEVSRRISAGWQAFGKASWILKDQKTSLSLKRKLYDKCILPSVVYGAETWNLSKNMERKLRSMQRAHERLMVGVSLRDHKTSEWIREKTRITDILDHIRRKKWRWAGHVARMTDSRWTEVVTFWTPYGQRRRRGRQRIRWRDDLDRYLSLWHRTAWDRGVWRSEEEAYVRLRNF